MALVPPESKCSPETKRDIVLEVLAGERSIAEICRQHQISATSVQKWREQFIEGGLRGFEGKRRSSREQELAEEVERLKKCIGDLAVANHILKGGATVSRGNKGGRG